MRGVLQDGLRGLISLGVLILGQALNLRHRWRQRRFLSEQARLASAYGITTKTPIVRHGPDLQAALEAAAGPNAHFAQTSGTSGTPKRIPYTPSRIRMVNAVYMDAFCRAFAAWGVPRTSLYVFSTVVKDDSLSTLMMAEKNDLPPYFSTLQAPYRVHNHPSLQALVGQYGSDAIRLWVLTISNPGCMYATNPSTVAMFLDALTNDWEATTSFIRDWVHTPSQFDPDIRRIAQRLSSRGSGQRLERIAQSRTPLELLDCVPALSLLCCWDGGHVSPYLRQVQRRLPPQRVRHLPMYSMSTETVETVPDFTVEDVGFVPMAPGVHYSFLPEGAEENPELLLAPCSLEPGEIYSLVVSDGFGLRRYHTEDVFRCEGYRGGLPDLRFLRRLGLAFSFTGEKLTGDHAAAAFDTLRTTFPTLGSVAWMVCIPSHPDPETIPGYRIVLAHRSPLPQLAANDIESCFDAALSKANPEYADKRASGRLAAPVLTPVGFEQLIQAISDGRHSQSWEAQFKFPPLMSRIWESIV